jgi:hypothetical protein
MPLYDIGDRDVYTDGYKLEYRVDHMAGKLRRRLTQPDRDIILTRNEELRKNRGALRDLDWCQYTLSIPLEDYESLQRKYPVLRTGSNDERKDFYLSFIRSPESKPYRVRA